MYSNVFRGGGGAHATIQYPSSGNVFQGGVLFSEFSHAHVFYVVLVLMLRAFCLGNH